MNYRYKIRRICLFVPLVLIKGIFMQFFLDFAAYHLFRYFHEVPHLLERRRIRVQVDLSLSLSAASRGNVLSVKLDIMYVMAQR